MAFDLLGDRFRPSLRITRITQAAASSPWHSVSNHQRPPAKTAYVIRVTHHAWVWGHGATKYRVISDDPIVRSWVPRRADVCPVPCKVHKTARDHPVAAECRDVQTCVQCPVKFTKLHVTSICRKRIQRT